MTRLELRDVIALVHNSANFWLKFRSAPGSLDCDHCEEGIDYGRATIEEGRAFVAAHASCTGFTKELVP